MSQPQHSQRSGGVEQFLSELRRRNVVRVGFAYLAIAWLLIQLVGEISPILDLPEWLPRIMLGLLAAGFVVALVLAWIYELTDRGIRTTVEVDADASLRRVDPRLLNYVVIGALTLALAYFVWESRFRERTTTSELQSVAVLPFRDLSERGDQQYFADGVAEELLGALSRVPGLRVAGRMSSFSIRDADSNPQDAARRLGVTHLLEGSVRTAGERLRVTAQLINARDGFQLWSREFEGSMADVFAVQDQISTLVVEGLKLHLGDDAGTAAPLVQVTTSLVAYNDYLLGRYQLARRTPDAIRNAIEHFRAATTADPGYAPAWAGLAKSLVVSPYYIGVISVPKLLAELETSARRAIELDPTSAEAWSSLGTAQSIFARDWDAAAQSLGRAVELQPHDAGATNLYGDFLYNIGDYTGALEYESRAAELEPLSAANQHELALVLELLGSMSEAIAQEQRAILVGPEFRNAWSTLGRYYLQTGRLEELNVLLAQHTDMIGEHFVLVLQAGLAQVQGDSARARTIADNLLVMVRQRGLPLTVPARLYADLGDDAQAAALVREAHAAGDPILVSPLYFFLPEDWTQLPQLRTALEASGLGSLYDLRRAHIAAGRGRGSRT
jgi:TolB-like protein/Tfp pilus assembly protein PilF